NKTATPVEGMVNTWDVLLEIEAKDTVTTSDIVLVIDRSGSMRGSKLTNAKNAALEFVDVLLPSTSTRIAVVSFAGEVTTNQALTNNATNLNSAINGLYANGGTFTQAAMRQAAAILANSTATYKNIVLLSDGEPTYSYGINDPYKMNTVNLEPYSVSGGTAWQTTINTPQAQFNTTRVGSGSSMWQRYADPNGTSNDKYYNNGHAAVAEAGFYKNEASLKYLYTIALDAGTNGTPILNQMASPGKSYTATESELEAIFAAIAGEINAAIKNASITDPMGTGFEVIGDVTNVETNSGTVNLTTDPSRIDWDAGTPPLKDGSTDERYAYLSYRIEINDDILDVPVPEDGLYETNGPTVVTYTNSAGSTVSGNFPIPKVDPILLIVEKVLKNDKGDVITNDDRVFDINITSDKGYDQTYSLKAGDKKIMTNLRLEDNYSVSETGVSGTPESVLADYETTVNVYGEDQTTFGINQGAPDSPVIVTNQEKSLGQLTVKKVFNNIPDTGSVATRMMALAVEPLAFSFTVSGPDGYEQTFDLGPAGEKTFENLKYGTYTVVENTTGYYTTYDPDGGEVILSFAERDATVTVTNRVKNGTDITATKIWQGGPTPYPEAWFRLFRSVGGGTPVAAEDAKDKKIRGSAPFTVTWEDMPQYSPEGNSYVYSVKEYIQGDTGLEHGTPAGYFKTEEGLTVTNKWISTTATINVQKALTGRDFLENDSFTFTLDGKIGETVVSDTLTVTDGTVTGFDELTFTKAGTYNFTITETGGSIGGLTYDTAAKPVTVTVVDNQDGTLTATVSPETTVITNTYVVDPAIKLEKTGSWVDVDADGRHSDGDQINYTFSVTNTGDVTLKNLILSDPKITVTGGPLATLAVGATNSSEFSGIYTLTQDDIDDGTFTNTATVTGYGPNDETVTATDDDTQTFTAAPSLSLTKSGSLADTNGDGQHSPGDVITYTFMVENTGNVTLTNVTLSDPDVSLSGVPIASLVPGDSDSTTFSATHTLTQADLDAGTYNNTATVTGTPPEGSNVTDTDSHNEPLTREPDISLVKTGTYEDTDDDGSVSEGDTISYVFT
ncbi:MAG: FctA domain-containing protein, partial [Eubacteriales bacterium]|nr:FctA domain-containing protein [Eubacteriales bacterium]